MRQIGWRRVLLAACLVAASVGPLGGSGLVFAQGEGPAMGPRDVAVIPIDSVPAWLSEGVATPVERGGDTSIEVLAVLRDPRDVPVDRFLYALTERGEVVVHPLAQRIRERFAEGGHSAVAVYVRVTADEDVEEDVSVVDPFLVQGLELQEQYDWFSAPWAVMGVMDAGPDGNGMVLPCREPMTLGAFGKTFTAPDTGQRLDPDTYLPPKPWYEVVDRDPDPNVTRYSLEAGDVREGWILCLAPNVPVEDVRVVSSPNRFEPGVAQLMQDPEYSEGGSPYWARLEEMPIGAWQLLQDVEVVGWNEGPRAGETGEPAHLDEQVMYRGDVWASMAQALIYLYPSAVDSGQLGNAHRRVSVQMYFNGMEELLAAWDQLALRNGIEVTLCSDPRTLACMSPETVEVRAEGSWIDVPGIGPGSAEERAAGPLTLWAYLGDVRTSIDSGPLRMWRMEAQDLEMTRGNTEAACAARECFTYVPQHGVVGLPDGELPIIPLGETANGLRIVGARFMTGQALWGEDLDVYLSRPGVGGISGEFKWLVIEVEAAGSQGDFRVQHVDADGTVDEQGSVARRVVYQEGGQYPSIGGGWLSEARSGADKVVLLVEVPISWQLGNVFLIRGLGTPTGPAWRLQ